MISVILLHYMFHNPLALLTNIEGQLFILSMPQSNMLLQQNIINWVAYDNKLLCLTVLEAGKSEIRALAGWHSGEGLFLV